MFKKLLYLLIIFYASLEGKTMKFTSPAFSHNGSIPSQYTCDGANVSPALEWSNEPEGTKSFALIVDDPDAPAKVWVHWVVFNIPNTVRSLAEGASTSDFTQGATDFNGKQGYGGPCPPSGTHHYQFTLYALDTMLPDLPAGAIKEQLIKAMEGHIIGQTTLIGTYQRKK